MSRLLAIGGSDAGISAGLRARELDPDADVTVLAADAYPSFSICGIPYYISGEVADWRNLAHRTVQDLQATGMKLQPNTRATRIDPDSHQVETINAEGETSSVVYNALIIATGALPIRPPITGLDTVGTQDGVHLLHSMGDTFALIDTLHRREIERAVIVGGGYIGLEMAEALTARHLHLTQIEQLPEVLPTVDPELGSLVHAELERHAVEVRCSTRVVAIHEAPQDAAGRLQVDATGPGGDQPLTFHADVVLVVVGVRPDSDLAAAAGAELSAGGAIVVDRHMRTSLPDVYAAGDCALTYHRLTGPGYFPLGTTAHKQGRIAAENALGANGEFAGSLGTQVVKAFDLVAARTGLRDHEASGYRPLTLPATADDHKAYYPGSHPIHMRYTADRQTHRLLGLQLVGHLHSEIAKRIDIAATAIHNDMTIDAISDLDLSYTPPLGSPWDAIQTGAQAWLRQAAAV